MATGLFQPRLESPVVRVVSTGDGTKYQVTWPLQAGSRGYFVYAGFDPLSIRSRISGSLPLVPTINTFQFDLGFSPPNQVVYFWVSSTDGVSETFLDNLGSYHIRTDQLGEFDPSPFSQETSDIYFVDDTTEQEYFFEEKRRRAKAILEDTGEVVDLFIKQWRGLPDPSAQTGLGSDQTYQTMTRDTNSFGTGFFPGFFPSIAIRMRFGALPNSLLDYQLPGLRPMLTNEAWTLWDPIVHENDLIVRRSTGVRYVVNSNAPSNQRSVPIVQRLTLDVVTTTSPLQKVTDSLVRQRWGLVNAAGYARAGFGIVSNSSGGPDMLIF